MGWSSGGPPDAPGHAPSRPRLAVTAAIGTGQILAWGSSYYLPAVLAEPVARATGWPEIWIIGALSLGLLLSGLVSPLVGQAIERYGGRPVLAASAILLAAGHLLLAAAPNFAVFAAAWLLLGLGMGAGLYDPAFATLGRLYGAQARSAITQVTLFGGFASTICWPLSALLVEQFGWRGTSLAYAAIDLAIVLPLYWFGVPREVARGASANAAARDAPPPRAAKNRPALILLGAGFTVASVIMTILSVNILTLLQARGLTLAAAVAVGALIGPAQVGARVLEAMFGRRHHPIWSLLASAVLVAGGLALLLGPSTLIGAGFVLYGAGSGIRSIARGTVPLALFGAEGYATLLGWIALPILVATAISPLIGAILVQRLGAEPTIILLVGAAVVNVALVLPLLKLARMAPAT